MARIINLTQHVATADQIKAGVFEPRYKKTVQTSLTFDQIPTFGDMEGIAEFLADIAREENADSAMIGGAPFFMSTLERALAEVNITPVYAFSVRESLETVSDDGTVTKTNVFKHVGFVPL